MKLIAALRFFRIPFAIAPANESDALNTVTVLLAIAEANDNEALSDFPVRRAMLPVKLRVAVNARRNSFDTARAPTNESVAVNAWVVRLARAPAKDCVALM